MNSNSNTKVPTQQSVKAYVDTSLGGISSDSLTDADNDTKIQVEKNPDEDKIRFDTLGTERMIIDNSGNGNWHE